MNQSLSIHRSGTTPYRILLHQEAEVLRVKLIGEWAYRDPSAFWNMVVRECNASGLRYALVMFQLSEPLPVKQAFELARSADAVFAKAGIRMAVVDSNKRSFPNMDFWQMTICPAHCQASKDCSMSCSRLFDQAETAEQWLKLQ